MNIAATKSNLLKSKSLLVLTQEGYRLLDEKRRILLNELMTVLHMVERLERDVDVAFRNAYLALEKGIVISGRKRLEELSLAIETKTIFTIRDTRIIGIDIPRIDIRVEDRLPYYSPSSGNLYIDEIIMQFKDIMKLLAQFAEKRIALIRIAREVQETIRKVRALEKIYLPYYIGAVKYIGERLEEETREGFLILKLIKERIRGE